MRKIGRSGICQDAEPLLDARESFEDARSEFTSGDEDVESDIPAVFEEFVTRDKVAKTYGRLSSARRFWANTLHASVVILSWLTSGYQLPWIDPEAKCTPAVF